MPRTRWGQLLIGLVTAGFLPAVETFAAPRPKVVIIYGDDVGYGDVGAYGAELIPTPNIDRLARQGLRFTDGHCTAATCSPSRYALLTGIHGFRHRVSILPPDAPLCISTEILTLPKLFQQAGYVTGVVGKWHLGIGEKGVPTDWNGNVQPGPLEIGFDYSFLLPSTGDRVPCVYLEGHKVVNLDAEDPLYVDPHQPPQQSGSTSYPDGRKNREAMTYYPSSHEHDNSVINGIGRIGYMAGGKAALWDDETMADVFVERSKQFIARHHEQPFLLFFSAQDIHVPRAPHPRFQGMSKLGYRGDAMVQLDWATGELMATLEEHGLTENTIVIFSSDNGPVYDDGYEDGTTIQKSNGEVDRGHDGSGPYRGGKYQIYEGGTRVPWIVRWPERIQPGVSDAMVCQVDFLASFAELLKIPLDEQEASDSRSTLAALLGQQANGLDVLLEEAGNRRALRRGAWKYIASRNRQTGKWNAKPELYHLEQDPGESSNVLQQHPKVAQALAEQLQQFIDSGRMRGTPPPVSTGERSGG